jgi:hypothetical protein
MMLKNIRNKVPNHRTKSVIRVVIGVSQDAPVKSAGHSHRKQLAVVLSSTHCPFEHGP